MVWKAYIGLVNLVMILGCSTPEASKEASFVENEAPPQKTTAALAPLPSFPHLTSLSADFQKLETLTCITQGKDALKALITSMGTHSQGKDITSLEHLADLTTKLAALQSISTDETKRLEMTLDELKAASLDLSRSLEKLIHASTQNDSQAFAPIQKQIENGVQNLRDAKQRLVDECSNL